MAAVFLLILGMTATLHCALDRAGLFESAPSCCAEKSEHAANTDECGARCEILDGGLHKLSVDQLIQPTPVLVACLAWLDAPVSEPRIAVTVSPQTTNSPPGLSRTWQFVERAALPVRAPALAS